MAQIFIVEDGTLVPGSNSYAALNTAQDYHDSFGHGVWNLFSSSQQQAALVRATSALDKRYTLHYLGHRIYWNQSLQFPRWNLFYPDGQIIALSNVIPTQLIQATCELALRAAVIGELYTDTVPLTPPQDFSSNITVPVEATQYSGGMIKREVDEVGPIKQDIQFQSMSDLIKAQANKYGMSNNVTDALLAEYPVADLLIQPLLKPRGSGIVLRG